VSDFTREFIETSVKRHDKFAKDRADAAIELVRLGNYKAAISALVECQTYKELADEHRLMLEVMEVNNG
jgi:hypothetical protein